MLGYLFIAKVGYVSEGNCTLWIIVHLSRYYLTEIFEEKKTVISITTSL